MSISKSLVRLCLFPALALPALAPARASAIDALPCDPVAVSAGFYPGKELHGMTMFEDTWPDATDRDFDDVVVTHNYVVRYNAQGQAVGIRGTFNVLALGGSLTHGLGLGVPVPASSVKTVLRSLGHGPADDLGSADMEVLSPGPDDHAVIHVIDDMRSLFGGQEGSINVANGSPQQRGQVIEVDLLLDPPQALDITQAPFDIFTFRTDEPSYEIHMPQYPGTAIMDQSLFGQNNDGSSEGRWFVDGTGLPYALNFAQPIPYTPESTPIELLYPDIIPFAASGGNDATDFYTHPVLANAYQPSGDPVMPLLLSNRPLLDLNQDVMCPDVPTPPPSRGCSDLYAQGERENGDYDIDPDGSGPMAETTVFCYFNGAGGWTNLDFGTNRVVLQNGHFVQCENGLSANANSVTCRGPSFDGFPASQRRWLYHYYCNGSDRSAEYVLTEMGPLLGHAASPTLGWASMRQNYDATFPPSDADREYCYAGGNVLHYTAPECRRWSGELRAGGFPGGPPSNGNCTPSFFTLSL